MTSPVARLADIVLDTDDYLETLEVMRPHMRLAPFNALCDALEVCPTHLCDAQICRDDEAECDTGQGS